jgi:hypothetical protein
MFCQKWDFDGTPHFRELVDADNVRKASRKYKLKYFG